MSHQASDEAFSMNGCRGGREPTKPRDAFQCQEWAPVIDDGLQSLTYREAVVVATPTSYLLAACACVPPAQKNSHFLAFTLETSTLPSPHAGHLQPHSFIPFSCQLKSSSVDLVYPSNPRDPFPPRDPLDPSQLEIHPHNPTSRYPGAGGPTAMKYMQSLNQVYRSGAEGPSSWESLIK